MNSLKKLQSLQISELFSAHGETPVPGPQKIQENIQHRLQREEQVYSALGEETLAVPEIVAKVYGELSERLQIAAEYNTGQYLLRLQQCNRVERVDNSWRRVN